MELLIILTFIGGGYWCYKIYSPQSKLKQKNASAELWIKESDEAYAYLSASLRDAINNQVPRWVKEANENLKSHKKSLPNHKAPDLLMYQPEKQAARKQKYQEQLDELNRVRDKFLRVVLRYEHSKNADMKLENIYDWHQWITKKASVSGWRWHELFEGIYKDDEELNAWTIKFQEIEKRFDDRLK